MILWGKWAQLIYYTGNQKTLAFKKIKKITQKLHKTMNSIDRSHKQPLMHLFIEWSSSAASSQNQLHCTWLEDMAWYASQLLGQGFFSFLLLLIWTFWCILFPAEKNENAIILVYHLRILVFDQSSAVHPFPNPWEVPWAGKTQSTKEKGRTEILVSNIGLLSVFDDSCYLSFVHFTQLSDFELGFHNLQSTLLFVHSRP